MSELTVEKVKNGKDGTGQNVGMFVTGNEAWLHQEAIDFLLCEIELLNRDARKFYQVGGDFILLESKEMVTEWRKQAAVVINKSSIELSELRSQLVTIERETAEKCADIVFLKTSLKTCGCSDLVAAIVNNFKLGEQP